MTSNTLIVHSLPRGACGKHAAALRAAVEPFGILKWVELRSLRRILVVFASEQAAARALPALERAAKALAADTRVGFSMANVEPAAAPVRLKLPDAGRVLFVSPPASPPSEWAGEGKPEEEPNAATNWERDFNVQLETALRAAARGAPPSPVSPSDGSSQVVRILEAREGQPALQVTHE